MPGVSDERSVEPGRLSYDVLAALLRHRGRLRPPRVERGDDVVIARAGRPVAHLSAVTAPPAREFGFVELVVPDSFFEPLEEPEVAASE